MGDHYMVVGEPKKALEEYARALEVEASFGRARSGLALAHGMGGHYEEALQESSRYSRWQDHLLEAFLLSRVGRYQEAEQTILAGMRDAGTPPYSFYIQQNLHWMRAIIAIERDHLPRAIDATGQMLETFPRISTLEIRETFGQAAHARAGIAHARSGNLEAARRHLETLRTLFREPHWRTVDWLLVALEGETALAEGDLDAAEETFRSGEPKPTMMFHRHPVDVAIFFHHSPSRDGLARVARARGDLDGAIAVYRRLNTPGVDCPWTSVLEPRFVLEVARLLDQKGDHTGASEEYERFLDLWKNADPDLPELAEARTSLAKLESPQP
jgi:tetratricopeptide (TPR) repeat protein